ncbi:MAG: DsbA family protein [Phycisphaerales bacterium]|nr:DsbA family protein [Phycisphaerales bacterium]
MARVVKTDQKKQQPAQNETPTQSRPLWVAGLILLLIASIASGMLALKQLGIIPTLPGCGPESGCGVVTGTAWGRIPVLQWPVSYLGLAYFLGMIVPWCMQAFHGIPNGLRWIARLGVLCSFGFLVVMVSMDSFCEYCIASHIANIAFWAIVELSPRQKADRSFNASMSLAFSIMLITAVIAVTQSQRQVAALVEGAKVENEQVDQMAQAAINAARNAATKPDTTGSSSNETQDAQKALEETTVVTADFRGRYLLGPKDAPVKVVIISDYQCPDCYRYEEQIMKILEQRDDVSLSVKHFPFSTDCNPYMTTNKHRVACQAAWGAEAAGILGGNDAFWGIHRWMFAQKGRIDHRALVAEVAKYGVDPVQFNQFMRSEDVRTLVLEDVEEAKELGIFFTPMIFINGVELKWYSIPSSLSSTVGRIATAIADGTNDGSIQQPPDAAGKYLLDWQEGRRRDIPDAEHVLTFGPDESDLEAVVWVEYSSDYLAKMEVDLDRMRDEYPETKLSYRVYPIANECNPAVDAAIVKYPMACRTALAAKAAFIVGGQEGAEQYHVWLLDNGPSVSGEQDLLAGAIEVGLDPTVFMEALESPEASAMVAEDVSIGRTMRFRGPPALFVNGRNVSRTTLEGHDILGAVFKAAKEGK